MESWQENFFNRVEGVIWSQWVALGTYMTGQPCRKSVVDPEALITATCSLGRGNSRIFDEAMDWTALNHEILKPSRLKYIAKEYGNETTRVIGAFAEYVSKVTGKEVLRGVKEEAGKSLSGNEREELFWIQKGMFSNREEKADPLFLNWGFLRGKPRIREHSGRPDLDNPANVMIRTRKQYGIGAKADAITFLLTDKGGSSRGIAGKIKYNQSSVYRALENLVDAGVVRKYDQAGWGYYWIDRQEIAKTLDLRNSRPVFFVWADIFRAFYMVMRDFVINGSTDGGSLMDIERARDLTVQIAPLLRNAGEPLTRIDIPDIRKRGGTQNIEDLRDFLSRVTSTIEAFAVENE